MLDENISDFVDGKSLDEKDIATVIGFVDNAVILTDDEENVFYLNTSDPLAFEIGTVEQKKALMPLIKADKQLREKILAEVRKGRS